jgi:hypothetical protein
MRRLALGWPDGFDEFDGTTEAFLISLAASLTINCCILLSTRGSLNIVTQLLLTLCSQLMPIVASFELARLWGRESLWLRFATAFNLSFLLFWTVGAVFVAVAWLLLRLYPQYRALITVTAVGCFVWYALWLHWFLARHGLALSPGRAVVLILAAEFATGPVLLVPLLLAGASA